MKKLVILFVFVFCTSALAQINTPPRGLKYPSQQLYQPKSTSTTDELTTSDNASQNLSTSLNSKTAGLNDDNSTMQATNSSASADATPKKIEINFLVGEVFRESFSVGPYRSGYNIDPYFGANISFRINNFLRYGFFADYTWGKGEPLPVLGTNFTVKYSTISLGGLVQASTPFKGTEPYIGAGLGAAFSNFEVNRKSTGGKMYSSDAIGFTYFIDAGVKIPLGSLILGLGYTYTGLKQPIKGESDANMTNNRIYLSIGTRF